MYRSFFEMERMPFVRDVPIQELYESPAMSEALGRLVYAGGRQDIFTDRTLDDIYKESTGIPRRINRICEKSLMYASQQGKRLIDEHLVRYIIEHEMLGGDV